MFCLANDLSLLSKVPFGREYFVLLKDEEQPLGVICDEVENVNFKQEHLHPQDLPDVMKTQNSPIRQLLVYQDQVACVCSGMALVRYLSIEE